MVDSFISFSCSYWRSVSPSIRGMLMSATTKSTSWLAASVAKASTPVVREQKADGPIANLVPELLLDKCLQVRLVVNNQDSCGHVVRSTRLSISLRSSAKSIGLVRSASAPRSSAWRLVSASP
jgi:hypothetical protein